VNELHVGVIPIDAAETQVDQHLHRRDRMRLQQYRRLLQLGAEQSRRYQHTSVIIATNLNFSEWASVFGDAKMTSALLDPLTHHCHIVETGNESYRFRHRSATAKARIKAGEQRQCGGHPTTPSEPEIGTLTTAASFRRGLQPWSVFGRYQHDELRYILAPSDVMGADYPSETFRVLRNNEMRAFSEHRTRRLGLEAWDTLEGGVWD